jgi:hypothetical protein
VSGIRIQADLKARCWVDEDTGCWHWRGGRDGSGSPCVWLPVAGKRTSLGVVIGWLRTGKPPVAGVCWHVTCGTKQCANPEHRQAGNRTSQMQAAGIKRSLHQIAKIAATKRAKSRLSCEDAAAIRASVEPLRVLAERFGVSISHASNVRRGEQRSPPAASVFHWRP